MLEINFLCIFTTIKRGIILNRIQLFGKDKNIKYEELQYMLKQKENTE